MSHKVRVGVIGTSDYSDFMYLSFLKDYPQAELAAICGQKRDWYTILAQKPVGCRAWVDAIAEDHPTTPSFYDGWKTQQVIEAALVSHQSGKWVTISHETQ